MTSRDNMVCHLMKTVNIVCSLALHIGYMIDPFFPLFRTSNVDISSCCHSTYCHVMCFSNSICFLSLPFLPFFSFLLFFSLSLSSTLFLLHFPFSLLSLFFPLHVFPGVVFLFFSLSSSPHIFSSSFSFPSISPPRSLPDTDTLTASTWESLLLESIKISSVNLPSYDFVN